MAMTDPARRQTHSQPSSTGPAMTFGATVVVTFALLAVAPAVMPNDLVMPAVSSLFLLFAALVALAAWRFCPAHHCGRDTLSYWDVAGALTLFGIFSGVLTEPEQFVRLIESHYER